MKVILTGFEPFGGEQRNPSREIVEGFPEKIGEIEVIKLEDKKYLDGTYLVVCEAPHQEPGIGWGLHGFRSELLIRVYERFKTPYINIIEFKQFHPKPPQWTHVNDYYNVKCWNRAMVIRPGTFSEEVVNWLKSSTLGIKE